MRDEIDDFADDQDHTPDYDTGDEQPPAGDEPPAPGGEESGDNPWEAWGQHFDPSAVNPEELAQLHEWSQALLSEDTHEAAMTQTLRDMGYLEDGESLQDFLQAMQFIREGVVGDDDGDYEGDDDMSEDFDPDALRQEFDERFQQQEAEFQERLQAQQVAMSLNQQLNELIGAEGLDSEDKDHIWARVEQRLYAGDFDPAKLDGFVKDTYDREMAVAQKHANRLLSKADRATPRTGSPGGGDGAPAPASTPAMSVAEAVKRTAERLGVEQ